MKYPAFLPVVAVSLVAFVLPAHTFAQSTDVRPPNRNQSARFKSAIFKGSGNLIQSNSIASFIGGGQSNAVALGVTNGVIGGGFRNLVGNHFGAIAGGLSNTASGAWSAVGGGYQNTASEIYAAIGGGSNNVASGAFSAVGGGENNAAINQGATVGGGQGNAAGLRSTVAGGMNNTNYGDAAFIGGGDGNMVEIGVSRAVIAGGADNTNSGNFATIGGGLRNVAGAQFATVPGGTLCSATHAGSFVWSGEPFEATSSWGDYTFTVRAHGGVRFYTASGTGTGPAVAGGSGTWTSLSDRNAKENFGHVNTSEVLAKVAAMPIKTWNYKTQADGIRHIGPTAQDFKSAFGVGESDTGITTVDADGVALAAIQGLVEELKERDKEIAELKTKSADVEELKSKLRAVEERLNSLPPAP